LMGSTCTALPGRRPQLSGDDIAAVSRWMNSVRSSLYRRKLNLKASLKQNWKQLIRL